MASPFLAPPQKLRGGAPTKRQVVGRVASPDLGGGQVAVLRLHAVSAGRVTKAPYSWMRNKYVLQRSMCLTVQRTPELRRTPFGRSSQNSPSRTLGEFGRFGARGSLWPSSSF